MPPSDLINCGRIGLHLNILSISSLVDSCSRVHVEDSMSASNSIIPLDIIVARGLTLSTSIRILPIFHLPLTSSISIIFYTSRVL